MAIGFAPFDGTKCQMAGKLGGSVAYQSCDGNLCAGGQAGPAFGAQFGLGDTVGCGLNVRAKEMYFTVNGELVGAVGATAKGKDVSKLVASAVDDALSGVIQPCITVSRTGVIFTVNVGQDLFKYRHVRAGAPASQPTPPLTRA